MQDDVPVIEISGVNFSFNGRAVLEDVNISIRKREFLAVIGPNGGGKTTLIKIIAGLLTPRTGTVRVFGLSPAKAAPRIGYMPQDLGMGDDFPVTVEQVALMGRMSRRGFLRSRYDREDKKAVAEALELTGMKDLAREKVGRLSGGQRQRLFIARALAGEPEMLLLDEPTSNVDPEGQTRMYSLLRDLNETMTIVVVSHDLMVLSSYVNSVACVSTSVHHHDAAEVTQEMLEGAYHCPVDLIAHGLPHRVLKSHKDS
ncbi:MAG: ABC transporter ATP-binding protein [Proteobacteria bacterium]|nr:ABC transporter ATP-binding protein [Pseudomonadota bacterium]